MKYLQTHTGVYETINLGNSHPVKLVDLIKNIEDVTQRKFNFNYLPMQQGDVNMTFADIAKAQQLLNYAPATKLETGLEKFRVWFEQNGK